MWDVRGDMRRLSLIALVALVWIGGAAPASALSCVEHPDVTPEAILAGTETLAIDGGFFDHWDGAVLGTVVAIDTNLAQGPEYGATTIDLGVELLIGADRAPETMRLTASDPGWMAGYPFQEGRRYFVPILPTSTDREPASTMLCDPITELDVVDVAGLQTIASDQGINAAVPGSEPVEQAAPVARPVEQSTPPDLVGADDGSSDRWLVMGALGVGAVVAGALVWRSRQRRGIVRSG
jgi:hypothetical protein